MKYTVIVMRPDTFLCSVEGFDYVYELQYVAQNVEADSELSAGRRACIEAFKADQPSLKHHIKFNGAITDCDTDLRETSPSDYTVLGVIDSAGRYKPWVNGNKP